MRVAVSDSLIFDEVCNLSISKSFLELDIEYHTTTDIISEFSSSIRSNCLTNSSSIKVHTLTQSDWKEITLYGYPSCISHSEVGVIHLAKKIGAKILSTDLHFIKSEPILALSEHGTIWLIDKMVNHKLLSPQDALKKINSLFTLNSHYLKKFELTELRKTYNAKWQSTC